MFEDVVKREIESELNTGKGCIVIDIGCIYNNRDSEVFDKMKLRSVGLLDNMVLRLLVDGKELDDCKLNHRYPNGLYTTISKKTGRRVSKIGYPYFVESEDFKKKMELQLDIEFVRGENKVLDKTTLLLPIQLNLDVENPVCGLSLHYQFRKTDVVKIRSYQSCEDGGWKPSIWTTEKSRCDTSEENYLGALMEGEINRFDSIITPMPNKLNRLYI